MPGEYLGTGDETAAIVPEVWSTRFFDTLVAELPFNSSVDRSYAGKIASMGDTVHVSEIPEFPDIEQELAEGSINNATSLAVKTHPIVVNKRIALDYKISKKSQLQSIPFMAEVREKAVYGILKRLQRIIIDTINPGLTGITISNNKISIANLAAVKTALDNQNVAQGGRLLVMEPITYNSLLEIAGFTSSDFVPAGSPTAMGMFNNPLFGFGLRMTTELSTNYAFHPSFLSVITQGGLNIMVYDSGVSGERAHRVNVDLLMGIRQMDNKRVVEVI